MPSLPFKLPLTLTLTFLICTPAAYCIDNNANGLSDVWEQRYNASALQPLDDDDGDGFNNAQECIAGTDPYDSTAHPKLLPRVTQGNPDELQLSFDTRIGKHYLVTHSQNLATFKPITAAWPGDNNERTLRINTGRKSKTQSPIHAAFWANITTDSINALTDLATFPHAPDGITYQAQPEALPFKATGYGARIILWLSPPATGSYTLFLSSGGPAELYFQTPDLSNDAIPIAAILPTQTGLSAEEWETYSTQRAVPIDLVQGQRYALELRYISKYPQQHVQIGWSGPGLTAIEKLDRDDLAELFFLSEFKPETRLLQHDYDTAGQTGRLWPDNTSLETGLPAMAGHAERITGDPGTTSGAERISFDSTQDLYATWLFNMSTGHGDINMLLMNGSSSSQEGPRINHEARDSGSVAVVRAGGAGGSEIQINVEFGKTYRAEVLATVSASGFEYTTPTEARSVDEDTFDLYISDPTGRLMGSATGLAFRDGPGVLDAFNSMQAYAATAPNIAFDDWLITNGQIAGIGFLVSNQIDFGSRISPQFFKLEIEEKDQDADGIPDGEELALAEHYDLLFFDAETNNGTPDATALALVLTQSQGKPEIALYGSDAAAFESNYPNTIPDNGAITLTRTGTLEALTVELCFPPLEAGTSTTICDGTCCMLIGSAGDEAAEPEDFILTDEDGNIITDTVRFAFGQLKKVLTLTAVDDSLNEYPESVNVAIKTATDARYDISQLLNGASIQIFDLPDSADNVTIFTGSFSQDGRAVVATSGSGFTTATLNGPRTEMRIWDEFSGLTSAQQDSHVHKSNAGTTPGSIIYAITETPGDNETDPLNGPLTNYLWDLTESSGAVPTAGGAVSKQVIIDSLFGQNTETPLYLNVHTVDNPAGEIWAFLNLSGGSASDPGDATAPATAGSGEYPQLSGDRLESEVRRFLNQATFGATDSEVTALVSHIETERLSNASYHRHQAYSDWIEDQINTGVTPQTYLLDFTLASVFQRLTLAGLFETTANPTNGTTATPIRPATWPSIDRSNFNPEHWYLTAEYPVTQAELSLGDSNNLSISTSTGNEERRNAHWQTMLNARDQLRQKMGYALQQIVVVSATSSSIANLAYAAANYQDMLNAHAFSHYRDVLGYVNWSPVMGKWLSSLQNQKAIDFDGDGLFDTYPDENLARENMQLFSIGLFNIWSDGSLKLSSEGLPSSTYSNDDIREFAKILTGQSFSQYASLDSSPTWGGVPYSANNTDFLASQNTPGQLARSYLYPMKMFGDYHSLGPKSFAGTTIDHSSIIDPSASGTADLEAAIDWLAGTPGDGQPDYDMVHSHVSTPAFISRRLIQRFTTSNPSQAYLHRVATAFKNSEGDLALTLKAILLDPAARNIDLNDTRFGMKKSPLEGYLQLLRTLQAHTYLPLTNPAAAAPYHVAAGDYSNPDLYLENFQYPNQQLANHERNVRFAPASTHTSSTRGLQMDPFFQETVFNYYLPDYSPGGAVGAAGLLAPELQLANEPDIIRNINYFENIIRSDEGPAGDELGGSNESQQAAFNSLDANNHDYQRLDRQAIADAFYPAAEPTAANGRTSESLADEALLDELDKRLTYGFFKLRYPYDPSDNGLDDMLKNPRECIIDAITNGYDEAYNDTNDESDRLNKFADALYLLTFSPEYQIKK
ncbi:MAG: hypothetical protein ACI81V_000612 [Lentimonas sp.]|jgi:uncharacterized protein (DUF1800 family)